MSQSGYTPILIYASGTTGNTPSASNLTSGSNGAELALNYYDGKLFYKDASGVVQLLASKSATTNVTSISFGTTGLTPSTATSGVVSVAGTLAVPNGGTGITSFGTGVATALGQNVTGSSGIVLSTSPTITTPTFATSATTPIIYGGTTASSTLTLQSTSGVGTSDAINFKVGNAGATTAISIATTGIASFPTTGAVLLPVGTTGQQPTGVAGYLRFNSTTSQFEGYNGSAWASVGGAALSNDTASSTAYYPLFAHATSGTALTIYTSSPNYTFTASTGTLTTPYYVATGSTTASATTGAFSYGTLGYSDTNILASFQSSVNAYNQMVLQNTSSGATASTNFNVSNNNATSNTNFGEFGINSSGFTGTGAFNTAGYVYLASASTDLAIGTYGANSIHFVTNSSATDAMTINSSNAIALNGSYGTAGQVLVTGGSSSPATWGNFNGSANYTRTTVTATASQTVFTVTYTVGYLQVYVNGVMLPGTDYTATNGTSVTLATGATSGDIVEFLAWSFTVLNQVSNSLTINNSGSGSASGTTFNGSGAVTISYNSIGAASNSATQTWTATQTFNGSTSTFASILANSAETVNVVAGAINSTPTAYLNTGAVVYYTSNASATWVQNLAFSSGTTMNTALATAQSATIAILVTQGSSGASYYPTSITIDGTATGVTTYWQGGSAPTKGYATGIDVYTYTVIKTASATYTVLASQTQF